MDNYKIKMIIEDTEIKRKLEIILNELKLDFNVDDIYRLLELAVELDFDSLDISTAIELVQKIECNIKFNAYDIKALLNIVQNLTIILLNPPFDIWTVLHQQLELKNINIFIGLDVTVQLNLIQNLTSILLQDNFDITVENGVMLIKYRPISDLRNLTMGDFKNMTLKNLYYIEE